MQKYVDSITIFYIGPGSQLLFLRLKSLYKSAVLTSPSLGEGISVLARFRLTQDAENSAMEDYKPFKMVSVLQDGRSTGITSVYDAAKYILEKWPDDASGPKLENCKEILLKCLAGDCSATIARVAFVEAAREAGIFIETTPIPQSTGKLQRWGKKRTLARDRRPR